MIKSIKNNKIITIVFILVLNIIIQGDTNDIIALFSNLNGAGY